MCYRAKIWSTVFLAGFLYHGNIYSGVIDANTPWTWTGPVGGGSGSYGAAVAPNNDNTALSQNQVRFMRSITDIGYVDTSILVNNSGGITEYYFPSGTAPFLNGTFNQTNSIWTDYHVQLGFGSGDDFVISNSLDALDFDTPDQDPTPTSANFQTAGNSFTNFVHSADELSWDSGLIGVNEHHVFSFSIDIPDWNEEMPLFAAVQDNSGSVTGYRFTIRQYPTIVPVPAAVWLFGSGLLGLIGLSRRKKATFSLGH